MNPVSSKNGSDISTEQFIMVIETVALIVPSNSFLRGDLNIGNSPKIIASSLKYIGYELKKILVVEENSRSVASELTVLSKLYDIVLILMDPSSGCVSQALANISLQDFKPQTELKNIKYVFNKEAHFMWPEGTKLLKTKCDVYPVIYFQRIFILTLGLLDEQLTYILIEHLRNYKKESIYSKRFSVASNGYRNFIQSIQNENVNITFEKYEDDKSGKNIINLLSNSFETIVNTEKLIREKLDIILVNTNWVNTMCDMVYGNPDKHVKFSIEVIEKCLEEYGLENIFLSFNGGKDCTVLLHLVQIVLEKKYPKQKSISKLFCLYVRSENVFKEQDEFIDQCRIYYNLDVVTITSNIKDALRLTLQQNPHFKACLMGTRRTDPFSFNLNTFEMTDPEWPQVMRCSPILDWHYSDIWDYLLYYKVPYCKLYDYGYTSLGNATNTIQNPSLLFNDGDKEIYLPAYKLLTEKNERIGRNRSKI